eukprot:TRINITY_DN2690_c1_g1_i13.p1 TRINITY_DN2690_c1_g1~~TRINITY_DN2690_c1_g1_i13.p1  ORF type:complete len:1107 (+),score=178.20 TRINITY_DN2690_c1_g1_i13:324-3644(+)
MTSKGKPAEKDKQKTGSTSSQAVSVKYTRQTERVSLQLQKSSQSQSIRPSSPRWCCEHRPCSKYSGNVMIQDKLQQNWQQVPYSVGQGQEQGQGQGQGQGSTCQCSSGGKGLDLEGAELADFWDGLSVSKRRSFMRISKQELFAKIRVQCCSKCFGFLLSHYEDLRVASEHKSCEVPFHLCVSQDGSIALSDAEFRGSGRDLLRLFHCSKHRLVLPPKPHLHGMACGFGWFRRPGQATACLLHTEPVEFEELFGYWYNLDEEAMYSFFRMNEEDFVAQVDVHLKYQLKICKDCRGNVLQQFKELKKNCLKAKNPLKHALELCEGHKLVVHSDESGRQSSSVLGSKLVVEVVGSGDENFWQKATDVEESKDANAEDGSTIIRHAETPELAQKSLCETAMLIFKSQVEAGYRDQLADEVTLDLFHCMCLTYLEELLKVEHQKLKVCAFQEELLLQEQHERDQAREKAREKAERKRLRKQRQKSQKGGVGAGGSGGGNHHESPSDVGNKERQKQEGGLEKQGQQQQQQQLQLQQQRKLQQQSQGQEQQSSNVLDQRNLNSGDHQGKNEHKVESNFVHICGESIIVNKVVNDDCQQQSNEKPVTRQKGGGSKKKVGTGKPQKKGGITTLTPTPNPEKRRCVKQKNELEEYADDLKSSDSVADSVSEFYLINESEELLEPAPLTQIQSSVNTFDEFCPILDQSIIMAAVNMQDDDDDEDGDQQEEEEDAGVVEVHDIVEDLHQGQYDRYVLISDEDLEDEDLDARVDQVSKDSAEDFEVVHRHHTQGKVYPNLNISHNESSVSSYRKGFISYPRQRAQQRSPSQSPLYQLSQRRFAGSSGIGVRSPPPTHSTMQTQCSHSMHALHQTQQPQIPVVYAQRLATPPIVSASSSMSKVQPQRSISHQSLPGDIRACQRLQQQGHSHQDSSSCGSQSLSFSQVVGLHHSANFESHSSTYQPPSVPVVSRSSNWPQLSHRSVKLNNSCGWEQDQGQEQVQGQGQGLSSSPPHSPYVLRTCGTTYSYHPQPQSQPQPQLFPQSQHNKVQDAANRLPPISSTPTAGQNEFQGFSLFSHGGRYIPRSSLSTQQNGQNEHYSLFGDERFGATLQAATKDW